MTTQNWQLQTPISAIVFDCDGTLSAIEGVNELATYRGVTEHVESLTEKAMSTTGLNPALYQERLDLIRPHRDHVLALGEAYFKHQVPDVYQVIRILQRLNKTIYVLSAGLFPAIEVFAGLLKIPSANIFAVDIHFDDHGNFSHYDETSPLVYHDGKKTIVNKLKQTHPELIHIGDGQNDIVTRDIVTRFIGYGGIYYRKNIADQCRYYINTPSMTPLLALALTQEEYECLNPSEKSLYQLGLNAIQMGQVKI